MVCVECTGDNDCAAMTEFCGADNRCTPRVCVPAAARCTTAGAREVCNARGSTYDAANCGASESCRDGACVPRICAPGAARCASESFTRREVCDADGLAYTGTACAAGEAAARASA